MLVMLLSVFGFGGRLCSNVLASAVDLVSSQNEASELLPIGA